MLPERSQVRSKTASEVLLGEGIASRTGGNSNGKQWMGAAANDWAWRLGVTGAHWAFVSRKRLDSALVGTTPADHCVKGALLLAAVAITLETVSAVAAAAAASRN